MSTPLMTLAQAQALLPGSVLSGDPATPLLRVHTDSRSLQPGDLFVALRGERFDAHDFLPQARAAGAAAALAETGLAEAGLPGLQVADSLAALQQLAAAWRARLALPLIAVTGSNGKTTVTQMIAAILQAWLGEAALATAGNYNNHIGVPLTLLRLRQQGPMPHRAAVLELGMNHPGEIALLAAMAQPSVALVNNAQREHQEFMVSVDAVARENGAVISALPATGCAVFPADDEHAAVWRALAGARPQLTFALQGPADVLADARWMVGGQTAGAAGFWALRLRTPAGALAFGLQAAGLHNVRNAMAAATAALAAGAPLAAIAQGLQAFRPVAGRSQASALVLAGRPLTLVNDSYNANPDSVRAAIALLAGLPAPRWLVLGDMGEVGDQGPVFHAEVGAHARASGIEFCWTAGALCADAAKAYGLGARHFDQVSELIAALDAAPVCASVLVKGSRFMRMESVVAALQARSASGQAGDSDAA
jgi:UDP-N-acetylmuramoyl-tripeptide--D-alanyl-D-alanine ligase